MPRTGCALLLLAMACAPAPGARDPATGALDSTGTQPAAELHDWMILPGERIGPVTLQTSEALLIGRLGTERVVRREIHLAEDFCTDGTVLYPDTPDAVDIAWRDSLRSGPAFLRVRGHGSRWTTPAGVRVGTTLKELEAVRGEPLTFSGFGWDYGGGVNWYELDEAHAAGLQLSPDSTSWEIERSDLAWDDLLGDRPVRSDHPLIRRLTVLVETISIGFAATWDEHQCRDLR